MRNGIGSTGFIAAIVLAASAGTSLAADWTVTTNEDDAVTPPNGSLRAAIAAAAPGDRIRFAVRGPITLAAELEVPAGKDGLAILGPASFTPLAPGWVYVGPGLPHEPADPRRILVRAAGVRFQRIDFSSIPV